MIGEDAAQPDLSEMLIANHFQHYFGLDKVSHKMVYSCIQALAKQNARSPMLEWVQNLKWDGVARLDTWMIRHWGAEDTPFVREASSKWLISAVARWVEPGRKIDWMLIVVGEQGVGKTSMPSILFRDQNLVLYGDHNHKDFHMLLHSKLCVTFDELDSFGKRESSNLKAMITCNEDSFRPPYGASIETFKRRFVLYGCGNRQEFLQHDPSGYRRYPTINVGKNKLKFSDLEEEVEQLWAEAWVRYNRGDTEYWEVKGASEEAEKYVVPNTVEEGIQNWIKTQMVAKHGNLVKDGELMFTMTQLLVGINMADQNRNAGLTREIAAILRKLGAEQRVTRYGTEKQTQRIYHLKTL
jgi:predicted P-loop ATPase